MFQQETVPLKVIHPKKYQTNSKKDINIKHLHKNSSRNHRKKPPSFVIFASRDAVATSPSRDPLRSSESPGWRKIPLDLMPTKSSITKHWNILELSVLFERSLDNMWSYEVRLCWVVAQIDGTYRPTKRRASSGSLSCCASQTLSHPHVLFKHVLYVTLGPLYSDWTI